MLVSRFHKKLAAGPNVPSVRKVQHEGEAAVFVQLSVQIALDVVNFRFHWGIRLQKHVGVASDQILEVGVSAMWRVFLDQIEFLCKQVSSVLQNEFRVSSEDPYNFFSLDIMLPLQVVKETDHIWDFASEQTSWFFALKNVKKVRNLQFGESAFLRICTCGIHPWRVSSFSCHSRRGKGIRGRYPSLGPCWFRGKVWTRINTLSFVPQGSPRAIWDN